MDAAKKTWSLDQWFWPFCLSCWTVTAFLIGYQVWACLDIPDKLKNIEVLTISVIRLRCDENHFWGNNVLYRRTDGREYWGGVCRDWVSQKWVLNNGAGP